MTTAETTMNEGTMPAAVGSRLDRTVRPVPARVYRVQDVEGRGPWRPGFSRLWVRDRDDHDNLRTWVEQFGVGIIPRTGWPFGKHFGCACRTLEQLRRWFTAEEYATLQAYGYQAVSMDVQRVLAESDIQLVFQRARPLRAGVEPVELYGPNVRVEPPAEGRSAPTRG